MNETLKAIYVPLSQSLINLLVETLDSTEIPIVRENHRELLRELLRVLPELDTETLYKLVSSVSQIPPYPHGYHTYGNYLDHQRKERC